MDNDPVRESPQARSARICREAAKACEEGRLDDARRILDSDTPGLRHVTSGPEPVAEKREDPPPSGVTLPPRRRESGGQRGSEAGCYG